MSYSLEHPNTIIIRNEYYPNGLTEFDIYSYYINNKTKILRNINTRNVMFFIIPNINDTIVKRKHLNNTIKLNKLNYEKYISGRTISIHSVMNNKENIGVIDIDWNEFNQCKMITRELYNILKYNKLFKLILIKFTGKTSFHLECQFKQYYNINDIKTMLYDMLIDNKLDENYYINKFSKKDKPNLDLSSNKINGAFITLDSLSVIGLKCLDVDIDKLQSFNKNDAKLKF